MFGKKTVVDMINRSAENEADRRVPAAAGLAGLGTIGAATVLGLGGPPRRRGAGDGPSDAAILNFALNLEYLEAGVLPERVLRLGRSDQLHRRGGYAGGVTGGRKVKFKSKAIATYAKEIAEDELNHVLFLRSALGGRRSPVRPSTSRPASPRRLARPG